ncbi:MAG: alkaline phosphatase family protein [Nocardioides sp.]|uniref:alkaline phosphatase family protein n=1 Tax=Nocardioides sp. TaxID=35761 RepID=UPI0039E3C299
MRSPHQLDVREDILQATWPISMFRSRAGCRVQPSSVSRFAVRDLTVAATVICSIMLSACGADSTTDPAASASTASTATPTMGSTSVTGAPAPTTSPAAPQVPSASPPGAPTAADRSQTVEKLLVFVVENHSLDQMQSQMPYTRGLAEQYGYANNFVALTHPSLPNYLAIAGGSTFGVHDDGPPSAHSASGSSVFGAAIDAGKTARLYAEAMTTACQRESHGTYAVKHNPWAYFVDETAQCQRDDVPLDRLANDVNSGSLPTVGMVIPDMCNDAHDCPLSRADDWMKRYVGIVLTGPDWRSGRLAVVITADEDDWRHGNKILTVVVHPSLHHAVVTDRLDHYSLSQAYATLAGIQPLGRARSAAPLLSAFGLATP